MSRVPVRSNNESSESAPGLVPIGGIATAAVATVTEGNYAVASLDLSKRLRVVLEGGTGSATTGSAVPTSGQAVYPLASAQDTVVQVASATLAASGAWAFSPVIACGGYRRINVDLYYITDSTGGTGGYPLFYPRFSNKAGAAPAIGDNVWVSPMLGNDTRTLTTPSGTIGTGEDQTFAPGFAYVVTERQAYRLVASANDTDVQAVRITFDCSHAKYFSLSYAEAGDTANPGALAVETSLAI